MPDPMSNTLGSGVRKEVVWILHRISCFSSDPDFIESKLGPSGPILERYLAITFSVSRLFKTIFLSCSIIGNYSPQFVKSYISVLDISYWPLFHFRVSGHMCMS